MNNYLSKATWFFGYYRIISSFSAGLLFYFFIRRSIFFSLLTAICVRTIWFFTERRINSLRIERWFKQHSYEFKQQFGPYGIRLINQAENDNRVKQSLAEVFTPNIDTLRSTVEQLEMMETLFKAGLRPDGDAYQLHDLKLKYGKHRLGKENGDKKGL